MLGVTAILGCNGGDESDIRTTGQELTDAQTRVLGFEAPTQDWSTSGGAVVTAASTHSQGSAALAFKPTGSTQISSVAMVAPKLAANTAKLDIKLPQTFSWGEVRLVLKAPSLGQSWTDVGGANLTGQPVGSFKTLSFTLSSQAKTALNSAATDLTFTVVYNGPSTTQPIVLDNLVVSTDTSTGSGSVVAEGLSLAVPAGHPVNTVFLSGSETLTINERATLGAPGQLSTTYSGGPATTLFGAGTKGYIDLVSRSNIIDMKSQSRIYGGIITSGQVTKQDATVKVDGTVQQGTAVSSSVTSWTVDWPASGEGDVIHPVDAPNRVLAPGRYSKVTVYSRATMTFKSGIYYLDSLIVEPQAILRVEAALGPVQIYVKGTLRLNVQLQYVSGKRGNLLFGVLGTTNPTFEEAMVGTVIAPKSTIELRRPASQKPHEGSFFAKSVRVLSDATVLHIPYDFAFVCELGDKDKDGTFDCFEECRDNPKKTDPGVCGCDTEDLDWDLDGVKNCFDGCPNDPSKTRPGTCGCSDFPAAAGTSCNDGLLCRAPGDATDHCDGAGFCGSKTAGAPAPSGCVAREIRGRLYWFCSTPKTFTAALTACSAVPGRTLVRINDATETALVRGFMNGAAPWLGANDIAVEGDFRWTQGSSTNGELFWHAGKRVGLPYQNWASTGYSGGASQDCVTLVGDQWEDVSCTETHPYICEQQDNSTCTGFNPPLDCKDFYGYPCGHTDTGSGGNGNGSGGNGSGASGNGSGASGNGSGASGNGSGGNGSGASGNGSGASGNGSGASGNGDDGCITQAEADNENFPQTDADFEAIRICGESCASDDIACQEACTAGYDVPPADSTCPPDEEHFDRHFCEMAQYDAQTCERDEDCSQPNRLCVMYYGGCTKCDPDGVNCDQVCEGELRCGLPAESCDFDGPTRCGAVNICIDPNNDKGPEFSDPRLNPESHLDPEEYNPCKSPSDCDFPPVVIPNDPIPYPVDPPCRSGSCPTKQGTAHPWCRVDMQEDAKPDQNNDGLPDAVPSENDVPARDVTDNKNGKSGDDSLVSFDFDPNTVLDYHATGGPFGTFDFGVEAGASFLANVEFNLFNAHANFEVIDAQAHIAAARCGLTTEPTHLKVLGHDLLPKLVSFAQSKGFPYAYDELVFTKPKPGGSSTDDFFSTCEESFEKFETAVGRAKKALRDAQDLVAQYQAIVDENKQRVEDYQALLVADPNTTVKLELQRFGDEFCEKIAGQPPEFFPPINCAAASPEEVINGFIDFYEKQALGLAEDLATYAASQIGGSLSDLEEQAEGGLASIGSKGTIPLLDFKQRITQRIIQVQFAIGPVPCILEVDSFVEYGIAGNFTWEFSPSILLHLSESPQPLAFVRAGVIPSAGAGLTLFVGAGGGIPGFHVSVGVYGDITLANLNLPLTAGAGLNVAAVPDPRVGAEQVVFPPGGPKQYVLSAGYEYQASVVLTNILAAEIGARVKIKVLFFSKTWKLRILHLDGFGPISIPLIHGKDELSAAVGTPDWAVVKMPVAFPKLPRLKKGTIPSPFETVGEFEDKLYSASATEELFYDSLCQCKEVNEGCFRSDDCCGSEAEGGTSFCFNDPSDVWGPTNTPKQHCSLCREDETACNVDADCCGTGKKCWDDLNTGSTIKTCTDCRSVDETCNTAANCCDTDNTCWNDPGDASPNKKTCTDCRTEGESCGTDGTCCGNAECVVPYGQDPNVAANYHCVTPIIIH